MGMCTTFAILVHEIPHEVQSIKKKKENKRVNVCGHRYVCVLRERPTQVEKGSKSIGLEKKDAMNRARWRVGVREIAAGVNLATPVYGDKPRSKYWFDDCDENKKQQQNRKL